MNEYLTEIQKGMDLLASQEKTIFVGQAVEYIGTSIFYQVKNYPDNKKLELPVAEDFQMGFCLGLAIAEYIPVCIFPRMNFAICAANQLFNHVAKWELMSGLKPHLVIKTMVGSKEPLDPGHQHKSDFSEAFCMLDENLKLNVINCLTPSDVKNAYIQALNPGITLIIEHGDFIK